MAEDADPGAQAIEIGRAALDAYARADWSRAHAQFAEADRRVHSPVFVLYMARCRRNTGRLLEARELLRLVAREHLTADAPLPWSQAVAAGHAELGTLQQSIPSIWVRKVPGSNVQRAWLGGRAIELSEAGTEIELDPGEHAIELWYADGHRSSRSIQLAEGRRRVPVPIGERKRAPATKAHLAPSARTVSVRRVIGYSALGFGVAGLVSSAITGLVAKQRTDDLKRAHCDSTGDCFPSAQSDADAATRWATASTATFIVGTAALAAGAGVLLVAPGGSRARASLIVQGSF